MCVCVYNNGEHCDCGGDDEEENVRWAGCHIQYYHVFGSNRGDFLLYMLETSPSPSWGTAARVKKEKKWAKSGWLPKTSLRIQAGICGLQVCFTPVILLYLKNCCVCFHPSPPIRLFLLLLLGTSKAKHRFACV